MVLKMKLTLFALSNGLFDGEIDENYGVFA